MVQTELDLYVELNRAKRQERINYYLKEVETPTVIEDDKVYTQKEKRQFRKWLKQKRKEYKEYFKNWSPWDFCYLYTPMKMILEDMFEYYKRGNNVWGIPIVTNEDGKIIEQDNRKQTLATALMMLEEAELAKDQYLPEANEKFKDAFAYIAEYMEGWWD